MGMYAYYEHVAGIRNQELYKENFILSIYPRFASNFIALTYSESKVFPPFEVYVALARSVGILAMSPLHCFIIVFYS